MPSRRAAVAAAQLLSALLCVSRVSLAWPLGCNLTHGATDKPTMTFGNPSKQMCRGVTPYEYQCQWLPGTEDTEETVYKLHIFVDKSTNPSKALVCPKQPRCPPYSCRFEADALEMNSYAVTLMAEGGGRPGRVLSDTVRFVPVTIVEPDPPVDLRAAPRAGSQDQILVTWNPPPAWPHDREMFPLRVELQYKRLQHGDRYTTVTVESEESRFVIEDVRPGARYRVRARTQEAMMGGPWSAWSEEVTSSPWTTDAVERPGRVRVRAGTRAVTAAAATRRGSVTAVVTPGARGLRHGQRHRGHARFSDAASALLDSGSSPAPDTLAEGVACSPSLNTKAVCLLTIAVAMAFVTTVTVLCVFHLARTLLARVRKDAASTASGRAGVTPACPPSAPPAAATGPPDPRHGQEPWGDGRKSSVTHAGLVNWEYWATSNNIQLRLLDGEGGGSCGAAHALRA